MAVQAIPLALSMLPAATQGVLGLIQKNAAKKLKPSNYIPPGIREQEAIARQIASSTQMPGADRFQANLNKATANTVAGLRRATNNSTALLENVQEADARTKGALVDQKVNLDAFKMKGKFLLSDALANKGLVQQQNQTDFQNAKSALIGAGIQNFGNAANAAGNVGIGLATGEFWKPDKLKPGMSQFGGLQGKQAPSLAGVSPMTPPQQLRMNMTPAQLNRMWSMMMGGGF